MGAGPWLARRRLHPHPPRPAGCWRSHGRSGSTHDSRERRHPGGRTLACKTAPPSPPPNHRQQVAGAPRGDQAARTTPGSAAILAAGRWLARRRLHPHPPTTASRMLALPWAIRQHARLPGAPPSWRQDLGLQDGASIPTPHGQPHPTTPTASRTLACKTASPPPNHRQPHAGAPNRLPVPRVLSNHRTCALRCTGKVGSPAA